MANSNCFKAEVPDLPIINDPSHICGNREIKDISNRVGFKL